MFRFHISAPRQASEYVWAPSLAVAKDLAVALYNVNEGVLVKPTSKYEFAFRVGAADVRTFGDNLGECLSNCKVFGSYGEHDLQDEITQEFRRQQALAYIKVRDDLERIKKLNKTWQLRLLGLK
jgi:hypothetical protein